MSLVDTHCHIQSAGLPVGERTTRELWATDRELTGPELVKRAVAADVTQMVCVGCDLEDSKLAVQFVQNHPECFASIGIHPHEAQHYVDDPEKLEQFKALAVKQKVVAIGECGLDFYYEHSPKEAQIPILRAQIELAIQYQLPLIFHVRDAFDDFWPIFEEYQGLRGVLHSYTDSRENMERAVKHGLFIGVNGIATFAKNPEQLEVYKTIPLQNLVLETDAPFLTPTPYRGSINEPRHIATIADFVSDLRGESRDHVSDAATSNSRQLFGL